LGFFGLTPKHKSEIHEQIFQLIYFGQGFTHEDVYTMPTYLRNFYYKKLIKIKQDEKDGMEKASREAKNTKSTVNPRFRR